MGGMFKLILVMTLAAVYFLPQDGVDALKCGAFGFGDTEVECSDPSVCFSTVFTSKENGEVITLLGCDQVSRASSIEDECRNITTNNARVCRCNNADFCNRNGSNLPPNYDRPTTTTTTGSIRELGIKDRKSASGRLHGQSSSVLRLCVVSILLVISSFGKP